MSTWGYTVRSLCLGPWWWFPSVFFGPWPLSAFLMFLTASALLFSFLTAGSNGPFFFALALTGAWAGSWARRLHGWESAVIVPHLPRHLFVLSLAIVVAAALAFAAVSIYAGNLAPALGPALLMGVGTVYCFVRLPERLVPFMLVFPWLLLAWALDARAQLQGMSHPAAQVSALVVALTVLVMLKRRLDAPVVQHLGSAVRDQMPVNGLWSTSRIMKRSCRLALFGFAMDTLVRLCSDYPYMQFLERLGGAVFGYDGLFFTSGMIILFPSALMTVNAYPVAWLMGVGGTRLRLAWTLVGRMVLAGSVPLLAFFLAVEMVQFLLNYGDPQFEFLLKVQILAFLAFVMAYAFRRKYPNRFLTFGHAYLAMIFWFGGHDTLYRLDFGTPILVLLLIGSAMAAIIWVGHGLARADYLE